MSRGGAERERETQNPKQASGSELSERQSTSRGGAERERETQNPKQAPGSELSAQNLVQSSNPQTLRS